MDVTTVRTVEQMVNAWKQRISGQVHPEDARMRVGLTVMDQFEQGIVDRIEVELISYALRNIEGDEGGWRLRAIEDDLTDEAPTIGGGVNPTERIYRTE